MSSIPAQQTKLDLELVPKENRLDIVYMHQFWNSIYKHDTFYGFKLDKKKRLKLNLEVFKDIFQICPRVPGRDFDALPSEEDTMSFLRELVYMHQFWNSIYKHDTFYGFKLDKKKRLKLNLEVFKDIFQICPRVPGRDFDALPSKEDTMSFLRELGYTGEINSLNDVVIGQMHQPWRTFAALINRAIKESKAYKTYLGYAKGVVPLKIARKFKKSSPFKKDSDLVPVDEEPVTKGKRIKRSVKKSSTKPATGIVIREPLVETKSKRKEKMKEVRKKSLRDFHKLHPSGSGTAAEKPPRVDKITLPVINDSNGENDLENEGKDEENKSNDDETPSDSEKGLDSKQDSDGSESDSESDQQEYDDDEVKDDDEDDDDKFKGDEDRGMNSDDIQDKKAGVEISDAQQEKENLKITQEQVVEDAHVTITTVAKETEVPDASGSHSSDLASKFLKFSDIPPNDAEIVSPMDVYVLHEVARIHTSTLLIVPILVIPKASPTWFSQPQSTYEAAATLTEFELKKILIDKMNSSESYLTAPKHRECYDGLIKSYNLNKDFFSSYDVYSLKRSRQDNDKDEGPFAGSDRGLKKRKTSKDIEPTISLKNKDSSLGLPKAPSLNQNPLVSFFMRRNQSSRLEILIRLKIKKGIRNEDKTPQKGPSQNWLMTLVASTFTDKSLKEFDELMTTPIDFSSYILNGQKIENLTQEIMLGPAFRLLKGTHYNYAKLEYDFEEYYKDLSEKLD
nr:hypothetical protein [Tanacetum cinerariifolium]